MGRPEGPRCYCYVNNLLRKSLDELARNYAAVVLDNEAGMEHLSRRTTNNVDFLIAVTDPTLPALRAVERILALSRELPVKIGHRTVLVNRGGAGQRGRRDRRAGWRSWAPSGCPTFRRTTKSSGPGRRGRTFSPWPGKVRRWRRSAASWTYSKNRSDMAMENSS